MKGKLDFRRKEGELEIDNKGVIWEHARDNAQRSVRGGKAGGLLLPLEYLTPADKCSQILTRK